MRYRTPEEEAYYRARDCIDRFEAVIAEFQHISEADLASIHAEVDANVERAVEFAERSPLPEVTELMRDVYA